MHAVWALPVAENKVRAGKLNEHWEVSGMEELRATVQTGKFSSA